MSLEAKLPPPAVALASALIMWGVSRFMPALPISSAVRLAISVGILVAGIGVSAAGLLSFR
ncbi:MAG: isoprenylcysteine carboxylmethyltransferase family protein, partial [Ideonella sp.]